MATKTPLKSIKQKRKRLANAEIDLTCQPAAKRHKLNNKNKPSIHANKYEMSDSDTESRRNCHSEILSFEYESDFDENGFIYYLGTRSPFFENPAEDGLIAISSSSLLANSKSADCIVSRTPQHLITASQSNSWFIIDFTLSQYEILPTQYTLRHYKSSNNFALRHWYFEGSNDEISWHILKEHRNDTALDRKCKSFTWDVNANQYFAIFRIRQVGKNSGGADHLACSGFEIYGNVRKTQKKEMLDVIDESSVSSSSISDSDSDSDSDLVILTNIKPINNKMAMDTTHKMTIDTNHNNNHNTTNNNFEISAEEKLCDMGFNQYLVKESLKYVDNNINCMVDWLYSHEMTEEESLNLKIMKICQIIECQRHLAYYALKESENNTKTAIDLLVKAKLNTSFITILPNDEHKEEENEINNLSEAQIASLQLEDNILTAKLESIADIRKKEQQFKKMKPFISSELRSMGFLQIAVQNALNNTSIYDKKGAIQYILSHPLNDLQEKNAKIEEIRNSGYTLDDAANALNKYAQNLNMAMEWLIQGKPDKIKHFVYHISCKNVMEMADNYVQLSENVNFKNMNQQWSFYDNGKIKNFANNKVLAVSRNENEYNFCVIGDDDIKCEEGVFKCWEIDFDEKTIKNKECELFLVFRSDLNRFCVEKTLHSGDMEQRWCFIDENELTKINPKELHQLLDSQEFECIICLDREPNARLQPCGHSTFCQICVDELPNKKCPICRTDICSMQKFALS